MVVVLLGAGRGEIGRDEAVVRLSRTVVKGSRFELWSC